VPGSEVEIMSFAVTVATLPPPQAPPASATSAHPAEPVGARNVRDTATGAVADWAIYERERLGLGACFAGPAIVAEAETCTLVGAGWRGRIAVDGSIELIREIA
jgi:N-methylhydantoinase A